MAVIIFKLKYVSDDEAQGIRNLLYDNNIEHHKISVGLLSIFLPAIWVDEERVNKARELIDEYQQLRQKRVQEAYRLNKRTSTDMLKENPVRYLGSILAIILICFFTVYLFAKLT